MQDRRQLKAALVARVQAVLRGERVAATEAGQLARQLIGIDLHYWARRLLFEVLARSGMPRAERVPLIQALALATYKDCSLLQRQAFDRVLALLAAEFDLEQTRDQETLGLVGALYKRRWRIDGRRLWLEQSLHFYRRGFVCGVTGDAGYTAINAAYIQDLLAWLELRPGQSESAATQAEVRRRDAREMRTEVIRALAPGLPDPEHTGKEHYWLLVTLAEAYLGIGDSTTANRLLARAGTLPEVPEWWLKSTLEQLVHLLQLQSPEGEAELGGQWQAVTALVGEPAARAARTLAAGKAGLALSGGGFRASFYHLGVLARLAELDMLRHLEVLSCVSGGSIVGAHYYLELRRLIQFGRPGEPEKRGLRDDEIQQADYLALVQRLINDFLDGVQKNLRMRVLANPLANLKMLFLPTYSRTEYLGELYERHLYRRIDDDVGLAGEPRYLDRSRIQPPDEADDFRPGSVNWRRCNKVPRLVLNATTLNSGHLWQFTTSWMGESPNIVNREIDKSPRLRRLYYRDAQQERYRHFRLGHAVAASSCVPGLFEPIELPLLYPGKNVRLVDGGVYDNLGVAALTEQDCSVMIVSDASGQLESDDDPAGGILGPVLRSMSVMMGRIRGSEYEDLQARQAGVLLKGVAAVHLTQGLQAGEVNWLGSGLPSEEAAAERPNTGYGVRRAVQRRLASVRTDLDSFSDVEAFALMNSGYHAMSTAAGSLGAYPLVTDVTHPWAFRQLDPAMQTGGEGTGTISGETLDRHLGVSHMKFFKVWRLSRTLGGLALLLGLVLLSGAGYWLVNGLLSRPDASLMEMPLARALLAWLHDALTLGNLAGAAAVLLLGYLVLALFGQRLGKRIMQFFRLRSILRRAAIGIGIGLLGWLLPALHLALFDRLFLRIGSLRGGAGPPDS
ncbi:MAG: patatin-like phospholipase family protein [Sedimenticola sp.]|nr:patatin-like phospholipase family protein [Sedimenticola sp.]